MMSHRNLLANFEQLTSDYFADYGNIPHQAPLSCRGCRSITTWDCIWECAGRF
ncbi:long-chain-fatty-acid--AMP ligase FadD28 domain protein [Mycobacterium xenopi 4042]|uniref:Long-chain-fatty-acid--AMP ligase FadD28 domain protein n=1 Tax=Mycobacterium xenopi 4042 TaxID=1299334 RepID=X8DI77_MYCXE|nr:long-chain-fatty-acid--AMP ligase FadD28 domain protein [Mycobacterium xenopi 4042]